MPFLIWNAESGWASFQYWANYSANHSAGGTPLDFLINQILGMHPLSVFLWGAGLWYFFSAHGARYRVFGWAYLILFVLFIALQGKTYFLALAYPPLFAGGAVLVGDWRVGFRRLVAAYTVVLAVIGVLLVPAVMPVLPPPYMRRCMARLVAGVRSRSQAMPTACRKPWRIVLAGRNRSR
jgi:hypothetical protein